MPKNGYIFSLQKYRNESLLQCTRNRYTNVRIIPNKSDTKLLEILHSVYTNYKNRAVIFNLHVIWLFSNFHLLNNCVIVNEQL